MTKIKDMSIEELEEYLDDLECRLLAGSDERNEIEHVEAALARKRGLTE